MAGNASRGSARRYPRTARIDRLIQEVVAEVLERAHDDELGLVTVTDVHCDPDLRHAIVFYVARDAKDEDALAAGLEKARVTAQAAIGRQARLKRTPLLKFEADPVMESAWRIEELIRQERQKPESRGSSE